MGRTATGIEGVVWGMACMTLAACAPGDGSAPWPDGCPGAGPREAPTAVALPWEVVSGGSRGVTAYDARPAVNPAVDQQEDGLPVFHLFVPDSLPDDDDEHPARLYHLGRCYALSLKAHGSTSRAFPKRSYTLEFEGDTFDAARHKVTLVSPFNDNSYLRTRLAFTLWNLMSPEHAQVQTSSAVVYVNGRYEGLYTVVDHINRHFLAQQGWDAQGELFKAVDWDANFSRLDENGKPKRALNQGFEKKDGEPKKGREAFANIEAFTAFVADASPEDFVAHREEWLMSRDYEDWWVFSTLIQTRDAVAKNAYHFRDSGPEGKWRFVPWDLDASFGQEWDTRRVDAEAWDDFAAPNQLFARMLAAPDIAGPLRARYRALLHGSLRMENVLGLVDVAASEVAEAARKDERKWGAAYATFPRWSGRPDLVGHDDEVRNLREWVQRHWASVDQQLR
ncbi:hypothetical protein DRW03_30100 [Corallococcus sp. H22C18031201]|uniref:CotH kinase family protein n=1 Tax=Citreicoccus inhibens TaxID=2849499 RepID=UPI000E74437D|nr:CotH kinase family protein [Citreicoccus inhibens]MBU8899020.1 CotH kinase family protein [Citreicoccus inhibens]RJS16553.1 hypothetical protein DRW03_30100 [Corallococcus sp. H22C18031201]